MSPSGDRWLRIPLETYLSTGCFIDLRVHDMCNVLRRKSVAKSVAEADIHEQSQRRDKRPAARRSTAKTVADLLIERLIAWGVDTFLVFRAMASTEYFESLRTRQDRLKFIQVRHEEAAAFAACGYAKYTGRLGVCLATSGPGGIHLLNGLYDAKCDGQPVLAITGHTFHDLIGTHYQQDVDLDKLFMDVSEYNQRVMGPAHVNNVVDEAIKTALARRGVSHITIPKDIQEMTASDQGEIGRKRAEATARICLRRLIRSLRRERWKRPRNH